jgi:hypothetical protein
MSPPAPSPPGCRRRQPGGDQFPSPANLIDAKRPRGLTRSTRDTQLGEDAHRYAQRNGVQVLALLRTLALNLLRCNGFRSIRAGLMAVAHDISRMLSWVGISPVETG